MDKNKTVNLMETNIKRRNIDKNWANFLAQIPIEDTPIKDTSSSGVTTITKKEKPKTKFNYNEIVHHNPLNNGKTEENPTAVGAHKRKRNKNNNKLTDMRCKEIKVNNTMKNDSKNHEELVKSNNVDVPKPHPQKRGPILTKYIAMDCEMVGIGHSGRESMLARVSLVNSFGDTIYDKFVKPTEKVTDYRTPVSGIRPSHLEKGEMFKAVQKEVANMIQGKILVGHALHHDLDVLFLTHPRSKIRDTVQYPPFRNLNNGKNPSLQFLAKKVLNVEIQKSEHNSIEDARVAMQLYNMHSRTWEAKLFARKRDREVQIKKFQPVQNNTTYGPEDFHKFNDPFIQFK